jgi:3D (Asp-Asp-Asp) domain-containing protein
VAIAFGYLGLPAAARATSTAFEPDEATKLEIAAMQNETKPFGSFPESDLRGPAYSMYVQASAYNSVPWQTDDSPFITASGTHVHFGTLAVNFLPIGTIVKIPEYFGDQIFVVEDRMNVRYQKNVDIWMEEIADAKAFGRRNVEIQVFYSK